MTELTVIPQQEGILIEPIRLRDDSKNKPRPHGDYETEWLRCTEEARELWLSINKKRLQIARLAIQVCDITHGGGDHWSDFERRHTLKDFAKESGIAYRTIHAYVGIYRSVVNLLPEGEFDERNWGAALRSFERIRKLGINQLNTGDVSRIYDEEKNRKGSTSRLHKSIKMIKSVRNHLSLIEWENCDLDEINEFVTIFQESQAILEENFDFLENEDEDLIE